MRFAIAALPHTFPLTADPSDIDAAAHWASLDAQEELRAALVGRFDGFAVAVPLQNGGVEHPELWDQERICRRSHLVPPLQPSLRSKRVTEAVMIRSTRPPLYEPADTVTSTEVLPRGRRVKSDAWARWVIALLGAVPGADSVIDYFTGAPVPAFTTMLTLEEMKV